jgi:hypothetical protein
MLADCNSSYIQSALLRMLGNAILPVSLFTHVSSDRDQIWSCWLRPMISCFRALIQCIGSELLQVSAVAT